MAEKVLKEGDKAPAFSLPASDGSTVSLKDYKGKRVVLYFYPKDSTPGCTKEACSFRDNFKAIEKMNAVILGVSLDSIKRHQNFIEKQNLPFLLLSDEDAEMCKSYGTYQLKSMCGKKYWGIVRSTFIIDEKGKIAKIFPKVKVAGHTEEVMEALS